MAYPSISLTDYLEIGIPGLLAGGVVATALSRIVKGLFDGITYPLDDQWHNAAFAPRLIDNFCILAGVSYFTVLEAVSGFTHSDGPVSVTMGLIMISSFWHFFLRNTDRYSSRPLAEKLDRLASAYRNWKVTLTQTAITFLACIACVVFIVYGPRPFG